MHSFHKKSTKSPQNPGDMVSACHLTLDIPLPRPSLPQRLEWQPRPQGLLGGQNGGSAILTAEKTLGTRLAGVKFWGRENPLTDFECKLKGTSPRSVNSPIFEFHAAKTGGFQLLSFVHILNVKNLNTMHIFRKLQVIRFQGIP